MIILFGSAHLDIMSKTNDDNIDKIDRIGSSLSIHIGGICANISINLAYLGLKPVYCGIFKKSPISDVIRSYLDHNGVKTHFFYRDDMSLAGYNAHIDKNNKIFSSMSVIPEMHFRTHEITYLIEKANIVFLDTNLPVESIRLIMEISHKHNKTVFIQAADKHNAKRMLSSDGYTCAIMNTEEYASIDKIKADNIFITMGGSGVQYIGKQKIDLPAPDMSDIKTNLLGIGDAFTSAIIKEYYLHKDFFDNVNSYYDGVNEFVRLVAMNNSVHLSKKYNSYLEEHMVNIIHDSEIDKLTQVYNRKAGEKILSDFYISGSVFSLLFIDIDHFKSVNDTHGHDFGDIVLREVAKTISKTIRKIDYIIRWGGEEFLVILNQTEINNSSVFAERLLKSVRDINIYKPQNGEKINVTISIGGSDNTHSNNILELISQSDKAMYEAKETGRNRYVFA